MAEQPQKRARVSWDSDVVNKSFLEACIHEVTIRGWEGSGLKAISWDEVGKKLKNEHDFVVETKQMKTRWIYLKQKYAVWLKFKNKTGNIYNAKTNTFHMSEEEWKAEGQLNKMVAKLRSVPLCYPELCTQLFEGATTTGCDSWGPSSTIPHPAEVFTQADFDDVQVPDPSPENAPPSSAPPSNAPPSSAPPTSEESSGRSKSRGGKRNSPKDTLDADIREVGKEIVKAAQAFAQGVDKEMDACMAKLASLEWGELDPRYLTALILFSENALNMKVWLRLNPATCESWVRSAGAKHGLLG